ncbi:DUF1963 domain-containing protein [Leptolyngbya ohadii]|uniref:DUF1963 domain-containing protein n=1 Tax=Leptolyngbya ohadii TaxID=1962290 RepID=UPI0019D4ABDA|nr:DUF1963 domain-containing protein [Leptolyngbya ohadii]
MSIDGNPDRPASETVYLELSDGQSHKFYEVTVLGTVVTIRYGRIGTLGQSSDNTYATPEKAQTEAAKRINEKLRKGYVRVSVENDRPTSSDQLPAPATSPTPSGISSRMINLAELPITMSGGRSALKFPLQRSLVAVELTATCNQATFTINLRIGSNIAYHFDVRSHQGQVVQNTCITGGWGAEERLPIPAEFISDQPFTLRITVEQTLVIYLNGQVLSRYAHRLPPTQISTVEISYPSGNLQMQSVQVFEQVEGEIAEPTGNFPGAALDDFRNQEPTSLPNSTPSLPAIDPTIPFPSGELLHKAVRGLTFLPRITQSHLPAVRYPLGFVFFERRSYDLTIPLARSLVCFEMVGTLINMNSGGFTLYLAANQETYYHCEFRPHEGQIKHWVSVRGKSSPPEHISIPSTIAPGQIFHYVLTMTESNIIAYLNNHPVFHNPRPQPFDLPDTLHLNYNASGLRLQLARVLEPVKDEMRAACPGEAIVTPNPQPTETQAAIAGSPLLETLPSRFEPLRPYIEAKLQSYIKIHLEEQAQWLDSAWIGDPLEPWQSKIGGFPYLPEGTDYPTDCETGEMMLFLMQINCADLPIIDGLALPRQGILQFYSGLNVPMCEVSPEQHRILYFPEVSYDRNDLITDFGFLVEYAETEEWYAEVYPLTFSAHQDFFCVTRAGYTESLNVPKELETLSEEFITWLDEQDDQETIDRRVNKLGGEVEYHSYVDETVGEAGGALLLELNHPCDCDDYFYFFIETEDLANLDFSNVESYFMRQ